MSGFEISRGGAARVWGVPYLRWSPLAANLMDRLTVRTSLLLAFATMLLGALVIGIFSLRQMGGLNDASRVLYDQAYRAGQAAEQVRSGLLRASRAQSQLLTATTASERDALGAQVASSLRHVSDQMAVLRAFASDDPSAVSTVEALAVAETGFARLLEGYVTLVKAQPLDLMQMSPDVVTQDARLQHETRKLEKIVDELVAQRAQSAEATMTDADRIYHMSMSWMAAITLVLVVLAGAISAWVTQRLMRQLGAEPAHAKAIAGDIAQGRLNGEIRVAARHAGSLMHSLAEMRAQLAQTLSEVAVSSRQVAEASGEITAGNQALAERTDQQTDALAQAAMNIRQMADIARRNADGASEAATLTAQAHQAARIGSDVVVDVAQTMAQIDQGTRAIQSITGVIEGIAFRTNILALNAAVEAAHAGEHGRGFAVVAAEVRELARRSADAAREINDIIHGSTAKVHSGVEQTQQARAAILKVTEAIQSVSNVMEEISVASAEQSEGIEEINRAVTGLDAGNQQNAALAQQGVVTARLLDTQARRLDDLLSRFELGVQG